MTLPRARTTELDGGMGIRPPSSGMPMAVLGQCAAGDANVPASYGRDKDVAADFVAGRAAEAGAYGLQQYGLASVLMVRTETTGVAFDYGTVDLDDFDGTSVVTFDEAVEPLDDWDVVVKFPTGGTIGVDGIQLQWSLDAGRSYSPLTNLGTAAFFVIPGSGGVKLEFAAGTVIAGDIVRCSMVASTWDDTELGAALDALALSALPWEFVQICGALDSSSATVVSAWLTALHAAGKHKWAFGHFRYPTAGESEAAYAAAFNAEFSAIGASSLVVAAGAKKVLSAITRRTYRRPPSHAVSALAASVSEEIDLAQIEGGRLNGVTLRDARGNPEAGFHDEAAYPGLDDLRALTLRTWDDETGVYVGNPRLLSAAGSDYDFLQKRRLMNLARTYVNWYFRRRLSKPLLVNKKTGFVAERELLSMESAVNKGLERLLTAKPKVSSVRVVLSRSDAVLLPPYPLTGSLRMVGLAYPKDINVEAGWALTEDLSFTATPAA